MGRHIKEPTIIYGLACLLNYLLARDQLGFLEVSPHPYLIITFIFGIRYGLIEGLYSGILGAGLMIAALVHQDARLLSDFILHFDKLTQPLLILVFGVLAGEQTESRHKKLKFFQEELQNEQLQFKTLSRQHRDLQTSVLELEKKMAGQGLGIQDFSSSILKLFHGERKELFDQIQAMLKLFLKVDRSFILISKENIYHQSTYSHYNDLPTDEELAYIQASRPYGQALLGRKSVSLTDFLAKKDVDEEHGPTIPVYFVGPVVGENKEIEAMVVITAIPFIHFNISNFRLFETILHAASIGLEIIQQRERTSKATPYHDRWPVCRHGHFISSLLLELEVRGSMDILHAGFGPGGIAKDLQRDHMMTLLANLLKKPGITAGYLEKSNSFVCYSNDSTPLLEQLNLEERLASFGISSTMAPPVLFHTILKWDEMIHNENVLLQYLEKQYVDQQSPALIS